MSNVDKFNYLKSLLVGPAQGVIAGLALIDPNYQQAIELLRKRFGNRQVVISSHMEALTKIIKIASGSEIKKLRHLYDVVEANVRGLESMEITSDMYGCFLTPVLLQKLPEELRIVITRNLGSETWELKDILKELQKELHIREQCISNKDSRSQPPKNAAGELPFSASSLYTYNQDKPPSSVWCSYCNKDHRSLKCNIVTSPEARKDILRKKGKCFLCLRSGHLSRNCQTPVKCFKCQGSHHVSLCSKIEPRKDPKQEEEKKTGVTPALNMFVGQSRESVLLQTAIVNVVRPDNESYVQGCRLVFDSCSQRTYITEDLAHNLALPIIGRDSLLIKTFGENDARLRMCNIVQVGIKTEYGGTVYVRAYVVPVICGPLIQPPASVVQNEYDHLRGLPLADNPGMVDPSMNIQILVGADYYWSLVERAVVRGWAS